MVPCDDRTLNYGKYYEQGEKKFSAAEDYTSHNTTRLNVEEMKELLLKLDYVRNVLEGRAQGAGY